MVCEPNPSQAGLGRFLSRDVLEDLNRYSYCYNNPISWVDLDGLAPTNPMTGFNPGPPPPPATMNHPALRLAACEAMKLSCVAWCQSLLGIVGQGGACPFDEAAVTFCVSTWCERLFTRCIYDKEWPRPGSWPFSEPKPGTFVPDPSDLPAPGKNLPVGPAPGLPPISPNTKGRPINYPPGLPKRPSIPGFPRPTRTLPGLPPSGTFLGVPD